MIAAAVGDALGGASQAEIDAACATIYGRVTADHIQRVFYSLQQANTDKGTEMFAGIRDGKFDGYDTHEKIQEFIKANGLKENKDVEENLEDLEFFLRTHKLRREDTWQS